jgi:hypothetical protein
MRDVGRQWRWALMMVAAFSGGGLAVTAMAEEPHLARALASLDDANGFLSQTSDNKGGHPQKAMALIAQAEAQIRAVSP